jgi:hypothetical protein
MQSKIQFDPDKHKYFVGGREIPSVTTILKEITILDDRWFKPGSDRLGTKVHEYLELIDKGYQIAIAPTLRGYIKAYEDFKKANSSFKIKHIELPLYDKKLKVCGKVDRIFENSEGEELIVDIKSGVHLRFHTLQLTGYAMAYGNKSARIGGLYLSADGKYKYKEYDRADNLWRSCVKVHDFKVRR